jgi:predicted nucleic acid-binding protein
MIILDTNVISEPLKRQPDPVLLNNLENWANNLVDTRITIITCAELLAGVALANPQRGPRLAIAVEDVIINHRRFMLGFDESAARTYARVLTIRKKAGRTISTPDAQIAAICLAHNAILATRNTKDFDLLGITLVNPWEPVEV